MPQTRFVLKKALEFGHSVVVVVNKIDRPSARPEFVVNSTFELFIELNATDEQVCQGLHNLKEFSMFFTNWVGDCYFVSGQNFTVISI